MIKSPIWDANKLGRFYWRPQATSTGGPRPNYDANASQGQAAGARLQIFLYKGGEVRTGIDIAKGRALGKEVEAFVSAVDMEEDENMTTKLTITMQDVDRVLTKNKIIQEGDAAVVKFGYGQNVWHRNQRFVFVRSHPHFTRDGMPNVQYVAYDGRFAMMSGDFLATKRSRQITGGAIVRGRRKGVGQAPSVYKNQRDDQVIDRIAYHYGFSVDVDRIPGAKTRVKKKQTSDWEFIRKLAETRHYTTWVDWDDVNNVYCIHYQPRPDKLTLGYVFHYGTPTAKDIREIEKSVKVNGSIGTLLEFHPTSDSTKMATDIEVISFDRRKRSFDTEWLSYIDKSIPMPPPDPDADYFPDDQTSGAFIKFQVGGRVVQTISNRPFKNKTQAKEWAFTLVNQWQEEFMVGNGTVVGTQDLRPRQIHRLTGIGQYSGDYYLTQVTHHYKSDGFYVTDFVGYRLIDQSLAGLIRRGQITQNWTIPQFTDKGIVYPGGQ